MLNIIRRIKYWLLGALLVLIIFNYQLGENVHLYTKNSAYSTGKFGGKAYFLLLKKLGYETLLWEEPLSSIPGKSGVIVILSPPLSYGSGETQFLRTWVFTGGTLLLADENENDVFAAFGIVPYMVTTVEKSSEVAPIPSTVTAGVEKVVVSTCSRLKNESRLDREILLIDERGVIMERVTCGKGKIIASSAPEIFFNDTIRLGGNGILAANCAGSPGGSVFFDEYHHGYTRKKTLFSVMDTPGLLFVVQAVCALVFLFHALGKRFRTPVPQEVEKKRRGIEFVEIMANLYRRAGARVHILSLLFQGFRRNACRALGLSVDADLELLAKGMAQKMKGDEETILRFLQDCAGAVKRKDISDRQLFAMARALDTLGKGEGIDGK